MDKLKQWVALTVVGCLAVLAAGWFLLVSPKRVEAQDLRDQAATQETTNASLRTQLAMLKAQAKDLPAQQAKLAAVAAKIPDNPALPALIRALDDASADAGVELVSIAPGAPAAVAAATPAAPAAPADPAAAPAAVPAAAPAGPSLAAIPLTIDVVGGYFEVQQFVSSLEGLSRALKVSALTLAPGASPVDKEAPTEDGRSLTASITGQVFMTSATAPAPAAAPVAPAAPAAVPAAPAS